MLIVITGMQSLNKKYLARSIIGNFNIFSYKGFTCKFFSSGFEIFDSEGNSIYKPNSTIDNGNDFLISNSNPLLLETLSYFSKINETIFGDDITKNNFSDVFCSLDVDYGLSNIPMFERFEHKIHYPCTFEDVISNVKNSELDVKVITGTFGSAFLDKLKNSEIEDEIIILNFKRNPSVSWYFNTNPENRNDDSLFFDGMLNCIELSKRDDVKTINFEDVIKEKEIKISEEMILPLNSDYFAFNDWICEAERKISSTTSEMDLSIFNNKISNFKTEYYYTPDPVDDAIFELSQSDILQKIEENLPKNLFNELEYLPLDINKILNKI